MMFIVRLKDGTSLTTAEVAAGYNESTFTMLFVSYFGDWDVSNNLMRAIVANGRTLSCSWAGRPNWHYHTMAQGDNIGASALMSQDMNSDYLSLTLGAGFVTGEGVHVTQLGDPSLSMYYIIPPTDVEIVNKVSDAELSWTASLDAEIEGYNIYRRPIDDLWVKVNEEIVTSTGFIDEGLPDSGEYHYLIKAVKLKTNSSRTFFNESLGAWGSTNFYASINEEVNFDLSLYPNPSDGFFTIQSDRLIELIEIYSPDGQLVQAITPLNNLQKVDLNQVKAGVYFVRIKANGVWRNKRVVIQ